MINRIRVSLALFVLSFLFLNATGAAHAAEESLSSIRLSPLLVSFVIAALIPILTGVLTKATWSSGTKGLLTLVLTAVQTLIVQNVTADGGAFFSQEVLLAFMLSFVISIASYYGVYKPAKLTSTPVVDPVTNRVEPGTLSNVGIN